ncbi:MAG: hypothetical protein KC433_27400 [Anaerolineales bacterium]|nr:hypothetical protein [Anaerolineales bacterium]MCB8940111.1 hypothetical protein [Ardenticatenaceae bacterium]
MSLEDRVKELEEELKVLKNEIRATLLDIEEQVLVHYYPSLYPTIHDEQRPKLNPKSEQPPQPSFNQPQMFSAIPVPPNYFAKYNPQTVTLVDESEDELLDHDDPILGGRSEERPSPRPTPPTNNNNNGHSNGNGRSQTIEKLSEDDHDFLDKLIASETYPSHRKVSFEEAKKRTPKLHISNGQATPLVKEALVDELLAVGPPVAFEEHPSTLLTIFDATIPKAKPRLNTGQINSHAVRVTVRKLLTWVDESVATIGKENTHKTIEMYIRAGDLSREMRQALLRLVNSSKSPQPTKTAGIRQVIDTLSQLNEILDHHTSEYLHEVLVFISEVNFG